METSKEKKFNLKLDRVKKVFHAEAHGSFQPEDATAFVAEYTKVINEINPAEYEFQFDATKLKVSTQDMIPMLSACLELYKQAGYRKIVFDCAGSATLKMQLRRVATMTGLENYEVI